MLAYSGRLGTSIAPLKPSTADSNLRGGALGFRSLSNYIAQPILEAGGYGPLRHLDCDDLLSTRHDQARSVAFDFVGGVRNAGWARFPFDP
ncbi:MAG TPA: hypothetical protein DCQ04_03310 [Actinobacteria bacterium]|nr:hypothetical protein [Actinomycetota bacterium]